MSQLSDAVDDDLAAELQQSLGRDYRLDRLVGQGGFGRVYRAQDLRLDRALAIKVIRPDLAGVDSFVDRFQREGIALAKLRHPGVVPIYDIRREPELIYLIMPFIDGDTLRTRLARLGRLPPKEAHRIVLELCDALGAAHRAGIVHRDIKPDNVILEGSLKKALLMDFGIATSLADVDDDQGIRAGTPLYMSPEQITGDGLVDRRSDLYSLGALTYHLLCGSPPFTAPDPRTLMAMHLTATPVPVRQRNPSIPLVFANVVERCLAKDPEQRPQSAFDIWRELQDVKFFAPTVSADTPPLITPNAWLFAWAAVGAFVVSQFGFGAVGELSSLQWELIAAGCAGIATLASPGAREALRELTGQHRAPQALGQRSDDSDAANTRLDAADAAVPPENAAALYDSLSVEMRRRFAEVPDIVRRMEGAVLLLRARQQAIDLALSSNTIAPTLAQALGAERLEIDGRLATASEALETLRLDLLRLTAGAAEHGALTQAIEHGREIADDVGRLLAAHEEVERLGQPQ